MRGHFVRFEPQMGFWLVEGLVEGRAVLLRGDTFARAGPADHVAGVSTSFSLALDAVRPERHAAVAAIITDAFSPNRLRRLFGHVGRAAQRLAQGLAHDQPFLLGRQYIDTLAGILLDDLLGSPPEIRRELIAGVQVANRTRDAGGRPAVDGRAAIRVTLERLDDLWGVPAGGHGEGLIQMLAAKGVPLPLRRALVFPFIEMAALGMDRRLPVDLLLAVARRSAATQVRLRSERGALRRAALEAARLLEFGPVPGRPPERQRMFLTRRAVRPVVIAGRAVPAGARVVVDATAACRDERSFRDAHVFDPWRRGLDSHIGFGAGNHRCLGRSLAVGSATTLARPLMERGRIDLVDSDGPAPRLVLRERW